MELEIIYINQVGERENQTKSSSAITKQYGKTAITEFRSLFDVQIKKLHEQHGGKTSSSST